MLKTNNNNFTTKLKDDQFLRFADNYRMGVLIIQKGYIQYFNKKFCEIFGYSQEEILNWKKREFYKIVHPEDKIILCNKMKFDDEEVISIKFRGIKKNGSVINIENFNFKIKHNNLFAVLSSYNKINECNNINTQNKEDIKIEIEIPDKVYKFFNVRAIFNNRKINEEISQFLEKEYEILKDLSFDEAIAS